MIEYYIAIENDQYEEIPTILRGEMRTENCTYVVTTKKKCLYNELKLEENINKWKYYDVIGRTPLL